MPKKTSRRVQRMAAGYRAIYDSRRKSAIMATKSIKPKQLKINNPWRLPTFLKTTKEREDKIEELKRDNRDISFSIESYIQADELGNEYYWEYPAFRNSNPWCVALSDRDEFVNYILENHEISDITNIYGRCDRDGHRYVVNYLPPLSINKDKDKNKEYQNIVGVISGFFTFDMSHLNHPNVFGRGRKFYIESLNKVMADNTFKKVVPYPIAFYTRTPDGKKQYFILSGKTRLALAALHGRPLKVMCVDVTKRCSERADNFIRRDYYKYEEKSRSRS